MNVAWPWVAWLAALCLPGCDVIRRPLFPDRGVDLVGYISPVDAETCEADEGERDAADDARGGDAAQPEPPDAAADIGLPDALAARRDHSPPDAGDAAPCVDDTREDNDDRASATILPLVHLGALFSRFDVPDDLRLCPGDEDWFEAPSSLLPWPEPYLFIRARIAGVGLCSGLCDPPALPAAPENTMTVEVYAKATGELVTAATSETGNVWITHGDVRFTDDIQIRIHGPAADWSYTLHLDFREGWFEDECEC